MISIFLFKNIFFKCQQTSFSNLILKSIIITFLTKFRQLQALKSSYPIFYLYRPDTYKYICDKKPVICPQM